MSISIFKLPVFDNTKLSFNQTKLPQSQCRQKLIDYSEKETKNDMKTFRITSKNKLSNLDFSLLNIEASTRLSCIIILLDILNNNLIYTHPINNFSDIEIQQIFAEIMSSENGEPCEKYTSIEEIFNHKFTDEVVKKYVDNIFLRYSIK